MTDQNGFHGALSSLASSSGSLENLLCTRQQFEACEAAWRRLAEESWEEQALVIFRNLFAQARTQADCWAWLTAELYFEAYAFALDDRVQAAGHFLRLGSEVTDYTLDQYNQRLQRFGV